MPVSCHGLGVSVHGVDASDARRGHTANVLVHHVRVLQGVADSAAGRRAHAAGLTTYHIGAVPAGSTAAPVVEGAPIAKLSADDAAAGAAAIMRASAMRREGPGALS